MRLPSPDLIGAGQPNGKRPPPPSKRKTAEFRRWTGVNLTDARTDIEDTELFWLENGISIGKGVVQFLNAPGSAVATIPEGIASMWGFTLNNVPVVIVVGLNGSLTQVAIPGGAATIIGGAATVTPSAHLTIWQGSTVLIVDPTAGYSSWDGTTYTVIDAAMVGTSIAVFEGSVWIGNNRTITFTAPASFSDFTVASGAGATTITDEAFIGTITFMLSSVEQLWIVGPASVNTISNVVASGSGPVVRTFAITNVVPSVGSVGPSSGAAYFRAVTFMSPGGIYAISGVTPQKLSASIDRMFPGLTLTPDTPAAVALVQNLYCLLFLVKYTQALVTGLPMPANDLATETPLILGFTQGKMFFASQGETLKWMTTVIVNGVSQVWGANTAGEIYQLFGAENDQPVRYKVVGKLSGFGKPTSMHALYKIGVEVQSAYPIAPTLTVDSDIGIKAFNLAPNVTLNLRNNLNQLLRLVNSSNQTLVLQGQGLALPKQDAAMFGHYLGWIYQGNDPPHRLQAVQMEYAETREWNA
jgi:hypothetical protein